MEFVYRFFLESKNADELVNKNTKHIGKIVDKIKPRGAFKCFPLKRGKCIVVLKIFPLKNVIFNRKEKKSSYIKNCVLFIQSKETDRELTTSKFYMMN